MNCQADLTDQDPITINQGSDVNFFARLVSSDTKDPYDLTSLVSCVAQFRNADNTFLSLALGTGVTVASPATIGKLQITLTAAQTLLLNSGINSFQVTLVVTSTTTVVQFPQKINVVSSVFT